MTTLNQKFIDLLHPGSVVYVAGSCGEPRGLLDIIAAQGGNLREIDYIQFPIGAVNQHDLSALTADSTQQSFFMAPTLQDGLKAGRVRFIPMHMRTVFDYLCSTRIDVALLAAARDKNGELRFGPNVDFVDAVIGNAKAVVIEENTSYQAPLGCPLVDLSKVDLCIEVDGAKPLFPVGALDDTSLQIGQLIAGLIRDGDCLQTGIGAVPAAILSNLDQHNELGFHGGLMDDGVMALIDQGNMTGARKTIDAGQHILGMALGSEAMLDWLAHDPKAEQIVFRSADYTHESSVIRQIDNFVSVNSAVEIDLMGQVNAEVAGSKQISGTGGSVDFMRSAKASRGGRSIVAMSATARGGTVSRIVPTVSVVTALRTDVDIVVTQFGVADLRNESLRERAERLIAIAHPDFQDELRAQL
jgi:4-hydroxybutyrate CoA-transferase